MLQPGKKRKLSAGAPAAGENPLNTEEEAGEVSEPDEGLSDGASDIDGLLDASLHDDDGIPSEPDESHDVPASSSVALTVDEILNRDYGGEAPRPSLPPVSGKLAETVTQWLRVVPSWEKIKDLFKQTLIPENVEGLKTVKINDLFYQKLPFKAKIQDQRLRGLNTYFARGVGPLVAVIDLLIRFEAMLGRLGGELLQARFGDMDLSYQKGTFTLAEVDLDLVRL